MEIVNEKHSRSRVQTAILVCKDWTTRLKLSKCRKNRKEVKIDPCGTLSLINNLQEYKKTNKFFKYEEIIKLQSVYDWMSKNNKKQQETFSKENLHLHKRVIDNFNKKKEIVNQIQIV